METNMLYDNCHWGYIVSRKDPCTIAYWRVCPFEDKVDWMGSLPDYGPETIRILDKAVHDLLEQDPLPDPDQTRVIETPRGAFGLCIQEPLD
jgi:hypothetical protein